MTKNRLVLDRLSGSTMQIVCRILILAMALGPLTPDLPASAQSEIQIEGVPVVTAGKSCVANAALVGFAADGSLLCSCFPGLSLCTSACFDLLSDVTNCGACDNVCATVDQDCIEGYCLECDPVTQDCSNSPTDLACYVILHSGSLHETRCIQPFPETGSGTQGDDCQSINGCAEGYGCLLPTLPLPQLECARYCDASDKAGPNGTPRCVADSGVGFECLGISEVYAGESDSFFGICAEVS